MSHGVHEETSVYQRKALLKQLETLNARDAAREAFSLLADADIPEMALSNGAKSSTKELLPEQT